ncbi:hypothetical protein CC77DRAFT_959635, partial [Alternaria alternata]
VSVHTSFTLFLSTLCSRQGYLLHSPPPDSERASTAVTLAESTHALLSRQLLHSLRLPGNPHQQSPEQQSRRQHV